MQVVTLYASIREKCSQDNFDRLFTAPEFIEINWLGERAGSSDELLPTFSMKIIKQYILNR